MDPARIVPLCLASRDQIAQTLAGLSLDQHRKIRTHHRGLMRGDAFKQVPANLIGLQRGTELREQLCLEAFEIAHVRRVRIRHERETHDSHALSEGAA